MKLLFKYSFRQYITRDGQNDCFDGSDESESWLLETQRRDQQESDQLEYEAADYTNKAGGVEDKVESAVADKSLHDTGHNLLNDGGDQVLHDDDQIEINTGDHRYGDNKREPSETDLISSTMSSIRASNQSQGYVNLSFT